MTSALRTLHRRRHGGRRHGIDAGGGRERRLLLEPVDDLAGVQHELGDLGSGGGAGTACAAAARRRGRIRRCRHGRPRVGLGAEGDAEEPGRDRRGTRWCARRREWRDRAKLLAIVARFQLLVRRPRRRGRHLPPPPVARVRPRTVCGRGELELDPGLLPHRSGRQQRGLGQVAVGERGQSRTGRRWRSLWAAIPPWVRSPSGAR